MNQIRDWLYIGRFVETQAIDLLLKHRIGAVLQLVERVSYPNFPITNLYLPVEDGVRLSKATLHEGISFIREQKSQGKVVLSACGAGISRSTTFAMGALMAEENLSLFQAYREIYLEHPSALPHPALCMSLAEYVGTPLELRDVMDGIRMVQQGRLKDV